jgi:hypothetical protein
MAKPQQPEIARSGRGAVDPSAVKSEHTAPTAAPVSGDAGPVPEGNLPGHHPEHEQDKPDIRVVAEPKGVRAPDPEPEADAEKPEATVAGEALRAAAGAVRKVRESLPGD